MTRISRLHSCLLTIGIVIIFSAPTFSAPAASALIREGQQLPGAAAGQIISGINNPAVNHVGGFSCQVSTSTNTISNIWGNAAGGLGTLMRTEGTFGPYTQTGFESFIGLSDSGISAYSPTVTPGGDSVWFDSTPVAVQGQAHPTLPGQFWSFASRPGITANGTPYFAGGITTTSGGTTSNRGLFYGNDGGTVLMLGGQTLANTPRALSATVSNPSFDYRMSANGVNHIGNIVMIAPTADDNAMALNGSGLMAGGALVQEAHAIPASVGGVAGENWQNFDLAGVNNAGDYFFTGDSSLATTADEFIFKNGQMLYRDGMLLDGQTLQGDIEGAYMNENADVGFIWDVSGGVLEALYLNSTLLIKEGDLVDLDGDGLVEPNSILRDFTGISSLVVGDRDAFGALDVYFVADIDINNTPSTTDDIEGLFRIHVPEPGTLSLLAVGGLTLIRRRR